MKESNNKEIIIEKESVGENTKKKDKETVTDTCVTDTCVTDTSTCRDLVCSWINHAEEVNNDDVITIEDCSQQNKEINEQIEIVDICLQMSKEYEVLANNILGSSEDVNIKEIVQMKDADIPECLLWTSILSAMESCQDFNQLQMLAMELKDYIPPIKTCNKEARFCPVLDKVDHVAQSEIPPDGPVSLRAVATLGDGNCLCRATSKGYFNDDSHHIKIRVRIVLEGVLNMKHYLTDDCLERGASFIHNNADLPTVFATFSEFYNPGQRLTKDAIACIYCLEVHSCARLGTYMGLWQLAQIASVLKTPLHTVYPVHGESTIRNDFHMMFFPVEYSETEDENPIIIMWTGMSRGTVPIHFVPLMKHTE